MSAYGGPRGENRQKTCIILLNGEPYRGEIIAGDSYVICCDGAYSWAKGRVRIDENLGDFDSLKETPEPFPRYTFPSEKNETDGELAVDLASDMGATSVVFYGGGGGREDHFLGNLHLLLKAQTLGVSHAVMKTNGAEITLCGAGVHTFVSKKGQTVSLLPFGGDAHIMASEGLKYPMEDLRLRYGSTRGISNLTAGEGFSFAVKEGHALVIINEEVV